MNLVHPRYPSKQKDLYQIQCDEKCTIDIRALGGKSGVVVSRELPAKIKELLNMQLTGGLPKQLDTENERVLYNLQAGEGTLKVDLMVGYPKSYEGEEFTKYSNLIVLIEDIKMLMHQELRGHK